MASALFVTGVAIDVLIAAFLLLVFGWILDSWHDPKGLWVGIAATTLWLAAFVLSAGAPLLAYRMKRRTMPQARITLTVWLPALLLMAICVLGFILSPP
jgi:hypothetical protein